MCGPAKRSDWEPIDPSGRYLDAQSLSRCSGARAGAVRGRHRNPRKGACFMEMASYLAGERWSDHPRCTHPLLAGVARMVNDHTSDQQRSRLTALIPSVIGSDDARPAGRRAHRPVLRHGGAAGRLRRAPAGDGGFRPVGRASAGDAGSTGPSAISARTASRPSPAPRSPPRGRGRSSAASAGRSTSSAATARRTSCASPCRGSPRACVPDPDERLHDLLTAVIAECAAVRAEGVTAASPSARSMAS